MENQNFGKEQKNGQAKDQSQDRFDKQVNHKLAHIDAMKKCCGMDAGKKKILAAFGILFVVLINVFLLVFIVFWGVSAYSQVKRSRYIGQDIESQNTITVSATGEVSAQPDLATINFSVVTEAVTVSEAMDENSSKMNQIIAFAKGQGVEEKDLKTTNLSIYPRYEWRREGVYWPYPDGERRLVGYQITQTLEVKIRDMEKIGTIIQGATDLGVNQVGDLRFVIDDQDELKEQAREQGIDEAKAKAETLALQLGVELVKITNYSESGSSPIPRYYEFSAMEDSAGMGGGAPEIETGENKITVSVNITWEIR